MLGAPEQDHVGKWRRQFNVFTFEMLRTRFSKLTVYRLSIKLLTIKMTTFEVLCLAFAKKLPLTALDNWCIRSLKFLEF